MITPLETVLPDYMIKQYTEDKYSIVKFKRHDGNGIYASPEEKQEYDEKLDNSFSRARSMVKQYGLCNPWDWFLTLTLDKAKYNRYDLDKFTLDLMQFIRDSRKRFKRMYGEAYSDKLNVLIVPENHQDGAWHMHGFISGLPWQEISDFIPGVHPQKLIDKGFKNWQSYSDKFGFCSLGLIRDQYSAVLYALKYISKDVDALRSMKGQHLYFHSRPLKKAVPICNVYGQYPELDRCLDWHGKFCSTGFVTGKDWTYPDGIDADFPAFRTFDYIEDNPEFDPSDIDPHCITYEQVAIPDWR